jgi:hypothetical protein
MEHMTAGGLILPSNVAGARTLRFRCTVCGDAFYDDEEREFGQHVAKCARQHEQEINEASPQHQVPFLNPNMWDAEYRDWVHQNPGRWKAERGIDR